MKEFEIKDGKAVTECDRTGGWIHKDDLLLDLLRKKIVYERNIAANELDGDDRGKTFNEGRVNIIDVMLAELGWKQ